MYQVVLNPFRTTVVLHCTQAFGDRLVGNFVEYIFGVVKGLKVSVIVRAPKPFPTLIPSKIVLSKGVSSCRGVTTYGYTSQKRVSSGFRAPKPLRTLI